MKEKLKFQHSLKSIVGLLDTSVRKVGVLPQCSSDGSKTLGWMSIPEEYQSDDEGYFDIYDFEIVASNVKFDDKAKYESLDSEVVYKFDPMSVFSTQDIHKLCEKDCSLFDNIFSRANFIERSILGYTAGQLVNELDFSLDSLKARGVFKTKPFKYVTCKVTKYRLGSYIRRLPYSTEVKYVVEKSYIIFNLYFDRYQNVVGSDVIRNVDDYQLLSRLSDLTNIAARLWTTDESDISESFIYEGVKASSDLEI